VTPEEATEQLRSAIIDHAVAHGIADPAVELLDQFAIVAHWQAVEADDRARYTTQFHANTIPSHVAIGLFRSGELFSAGRFDGEDDC